jgi:hypothetical protein
MSFTSVPRVSLSGEPSIRSLASPLVEDTVLVLLVLEQPNPTARSASEIAHGKSGT